MKRMFWALLALAMIAGCNQKAKDEHPSMYPKLETIDKTVGTGAEVAEKDMVFLQYSVALAKKNVPFESNDPETSEKNKNPLVFVVGPNGAVIPGMMAGVKGMKVGGTRTLHVPWSNGYGASGSEDVPPYSDLIFEIKLLHVVKPGEENDVNVEDIKIGTGTELKSGDVAEVHYIGKFVNNRMFDSTYARKQTVTFTLGKGQAITGFEKGIEGMRVGGKRKLLLNPGAGWGIYGYDVVPSNAALIYEVELISVKPGGGS